MASAELAGTAAQLLGCERVRLYQDSLFHKRPQDGNMSAIAFALDPSGYRVELVQRGAQD